MLSSSSSATITVTMMVTIIADHDGCRQMLLVKLVDNSVIKSAKYVSQRECEWVRERERESSSVSVSEVVDWGRKGGGGMIQVMRWIWHAVDWIWKNGFVWLCRGVLESWFHFSYHIFHLISPRWFERKKTLVVSIKEIKLNTVTKVKIQYDKGEGEGG